MNGLIIFMLNNISSLLLKGKEKKVHEGKFLGHTITIN